VSATSIHSWNGSRTPGQGQLLGPGSTGFREHLSEFSALTRNVNAAALDWSRQQIVDSESQKAADETLNRQLMLAFASAFLTVASAGTGSVLAASALGTGGVSYLGGMYGTAGIKLTPAEQQYLEGFRKGHAIAEELSQRRVEPQSCSTTTLQRKGRKGPRRTQGVSVRPETWPLGGQYPRTPPISRRPLVTLDRHG